MWYGSLLYGLCFILRRGDQLVQINGMALQDLTPEVLAELLAEGNPMLVSSCTNQHIQHTDFFITYYPF